MEDFEDDDFTEPASGVSDDISGYLEDKFNMPGTDDRVPEVKSEMGFDQWMTDKFREAGM